MTAEEHKNAGYITLKEAGERFGYSADYIGQLIRKGKLEGKQVYANVAWMTTPEAMEEYLATEGRAGKSEKEKLPFSRERFILSLFDNNGSRALAIMLYVVVTILSVILLAVFYFLSVATDHILHERAKERLLKNTPDVSVMLEHHPSFSYVNEGSPMELSSRNI